MEFTPVTHVLFDMDGLILNTENLYTVAFQNIVSKYGKDYTFELKLKLMGSQTHETANTIVKELDLPMTPEEFIIESKKQFELLFPDTEVLPGAKRLIEHLHNKNFPIGLATSSSEESYHLKIDKHHQALFSLFPYKTFGSSDPNVKRGKPYPDIFLVAANKFPENPKPEQCLVFEDAVNGVKAAKAAGMQVVMVPDQRLDKRMTTDATLVLNSLEDFKPEIFGLPPFDD
ncbi:pseudouridine-5'-phosphatase-like [Epargyreus clarus]|uniref:pseudouridine-5'-phosphatase-like n=1 Tax=Epargyreus clarus TaxID=520877 RepID=UPI003C2AEFD1